MGMSDQEREGCSSRLHAHRAADRDHHHRHPRRHRDPDVPQPARPRPRTRPSRAARTSSRWGHGVRGRPGAPGHVPGVAVNPTTLVDSDGESLHRQLADEPVHGRPDGSRIRTRAPGSRAATPTSASGRRASSLTGHLSDGGSSWSGSPERAACSCRKLPSLVETTAVRADHIPARPRLGATCLT